MNESNQSSQFPAQKPSGNAIKYVVPINRTKLSIAAGYVALFVIPFIFVGPVALLLGILARVELADHPDKLGKGRALFAIIYGAIGTFLTVLVLLDLLITHK